MLPNGSYYIVRPNIAPVESEHVYLGNETIPRPINMAVLSKGENPVYSLIVTAPPEREPQFDELLIGVVILNAKGTTWVELGDFPYQHLVVFFSLSRPQPSTDQNLHYAVVIPENSELVLDNTQLYSNNTRRNTLQNVQPNPESLKRWQDHFAPRFARFLCV